MNIILGAIFSIGTLFFLISIFKGVGLAMLLNTNALLIIFGGITVALFVGFPPQRILNAAYDVIAAFRDRRDREDLVKDILDIAKIYRKADIRNLESRIPKINDNFLRLGVNLLINYNGNDDIRSIMEREMMIRLVNYNFSQNILKTVARLAPSLGLAGTIISLISMFKNFQSVDAIAPLMSIALMSTFYGVIISNLFALPLCAKLKEKAIISETLMNLTIEGILAVNTMEPPLKIEDRLAGRNDFLEMGLQRMKDKLPLANVSSISQ
jgi:chemotaxis protein MotA